MGDPWIDALITIPIGATTDEAAIDLGRKVLETFPGTTFGVRGTWDPPVQVSVEEWSGNSRSCHVPYIFEGDTWALDTLWHFSQPSEGSEEEEGVHMPQGYGLLSITIYRPYDKPSGYDRIWDLIKLLFVESNALHAIVGTGVGVGDPMEAGYDYSIEWFAVAPSPAHIFAEEIVDFVGIEKFEGIQVWDRIDNGVYVWLDPEFSYRWTRDSRATRLNEIYEGTIEYFNQIGYVSRPRLGNPLREAYDNEIRRRPPYST